jgi:hypothetical protein
MYVPEGEPLFSDGAGVAGSVVDGVVITGGLGTIVVGVSGAAVGVQHPAAGAATAGAE